ncbi:MAG: MBOAT family protein [Candidatus Rokubacteria bacterium]|nr:MBOAT family protein [Candidatus Rokubacteria bacterium]
MTFQSLSYWIFLPVACAVAAAPGVVRRRLLGVLALSYLFYATWGVWLPLLLLASTLLNHGAAIVIRRWPAAWSLACGIALNVALLGAFKYGGVWSERIALPVGLSFFTFQGLSHLIDTYREDDTRPTLLEFAVYMAFWPTVLAGPITRVHGIVPQLRSLGRPSWDDLAVGARQILTGLFMKMVVADTLATGIQVGEGVTFGFDRLASGWSGIDAWFLAIGFGLQLYFDFAGYSNVAIGSARLLGIRLPENFDHPYLADSPAAFWSRWHMSLSRWIRDYLFFPLATALPHAPGRYLAVIVSMLVFGMWHGVGWTFVAWGLYHGLLQVAHRAVQPWLPGRGAPAALRAAWQSVAWVSTFLLVSYGWLLFRSADLAQAWALTRALLAPWSYATFSLRPNFYILVALVAALYFAYGWSRGIAARLATSRRVDGLVTVLRPAYYGALVIAVIIWSHQSSVFVYFQF